MPGGSYCFCFSEMIQRRRRLVEFGTPCLFKPVDIQARALSENPVFLSHVRTSVYTWFLLWTAYASIHEIRREPEELWEHVNSWDAGWLLQFLFICDDSAQTTAGRIWDSVLIWKSIWFVRPMGTRKLSIIHGASYAAYAAHANQRRVEGIHRISGLCTGGAPSGNGNSIYNKENYKNS